MAELNTPRMASAFPNTPAPQRTQNRPLQPSRLKPVATRRPKPPRDILQPYIPLDIVDAPTQRFYAIGVAIGLAAWKVYDINSLWELDEGESISELWFLFKWIMIHVSYIGMLIWLRIPWLTLSYTAAGLGIGLATLFDVLVAFKISIPFSGLIFGLWKLVYDRELSLSEKSVKLHDITHNSSHIQGKYTVHILPEGTAMMNPLGDCFCLETATSSLPIPIRINGTEPVTIQLTRIDFESGEVHTIDIKEKETKKLFKNAKRDDDPNLRYIHYIVKQPGLYRLAKVIDVSMLDVRITKSETLVVHCPKATIQANPSRKKDKCNGELSDLTVMVEGLAPLVLGYSRIVQNDHQYKSLSRIHPQDNFKSPLLNGHTRGQIIDIENEDFKDFAWAKRNTMPINLNESLSSIGNWMYALDKVTDACGNVVEYSRVNDEGEVVYPKLNSLAHTFAVHARPQASFARCDMMHPMSLPPKRQTNLDFRLDFKEEDAPYKIQYSHEIEGPDGPTEPVTKDLTLKVPRGAIQITQPGLYSLKSVSNKFCSGDIIEPASCHVITPPKPSITLAYDEILDKCTNSSIGLTIDLTLVGTPDFTLHYRLFHDDKPVQQKKLIIDKTRYQASFKPTLAGRYIYEFFQLDDKWNEGLVLNDTSMRVEQIVKPLAGATFNDPKAVRVPRKSCIEEKVEFEILLQGTPPWTLHYDIIHSGKKASYSDRAIMDNIHTIRTPSLNNGGQYTLALATIEDVSGCKIFLEEEAKIDVRYDKPRAAFAPVEGKLEMRALEGRSVPIPLRMSGEKPWVVRARNMDRPSDPLLVQNIHDANSVLKVPRAGRYELIDVEDIAGCAGSITQSNKFFSVSWVERPTIRISESASIQKEEDVFVRKDVCEGDEDSVEVGFTGSPPYVVTYIPSVKSVGNTHFTVSKQAEFSAGLGVATVRLDTSSAGLHRYEFLSIGDSSYDNPKETRLKQPLVLQQQVHSRPVAKFADAGKTYKYCRDAGAGDDIIPIHLTGTAPFHLTINIRHHSTGKTDTLNIPTIDKNVYNWKVQPNYLTLGTHSISIIKVKDSRNCVRKIQPQDAPVVYVAVANLPTIAPEDTKDDYCVGDRISYALQGSPPFTVQYLFEGLVRTANSGPRFTRVAPAPGNFTITGLLDSASDCMVNLQETKMIHEIPSAIVLPGVKGIHEGDQAEVRFQFHGTPPFTFTYTRSEISKKGGKSRVMEQHSKTTNDYTYSIFTSQEGTYEVASVEDRYCSYSTKGKR